MLLRWEFVRGHDRVVCQMAREADCLFSVALLPFGRIGKAAASIFESTSAALRYHASLSAGLRDTGWTLVGYTH